MQIIKVLNNSLLLTVDEGGHEVVLMGKGIGYNKSIGHEISESDIQKVFILQDRMIFNNILQLANEVDEDFFEIANMVISHAKNYYHMELMEYIYLSLTDHIAQTVKRIKEGILIPNLYNVYIRQFNAEEYAIGEYAVELINEKLDIVVPDEEIGNIAIHFINAQKESSLSNNGNEEITEFVNSILDIVKKNFMIEFDTDSISYNRFITHLQTFSKRLFKNEISTEKINLDIYRNISENYPKSSLCADRIGLFIEKNYNIKISQQEKIYLTIHIQKIIEELRRDF